MRENYRMSNRACEKEMKGEKESKIPLPVSLGQWAWVREMERLRLRDEEWTWGEMEGFWSDESWVRECELEREIGDKENRENKRAWVAVDRKSVV